MMKLLKFRVTNFRSVSDSGWIETDDVTALIGTNEAGKTNLLIPLWKLNPAKDGAINAIADYPRKRYNEIRAMETKPVFIEAYFEIGGELVEKIISLTGAAAHDVRVAKVTRSFSGGYTVVFPYEKDVTSVAQIDAAVPLNAAHDDITGMEDGEEADSPKDHVLAAIREALDNSVIAGDRLDLSMLNQVKASLLSARPDVAESSPILIRLDQAIQTIADLEKRANHSSPTGNQEARNLVCRSIPSFVYYSNYGNLDSEIYLPHVIDNMERTDLGNREQAKARTLKVLFEFVKLQPKEILELGRESPVIITN